MCKIIHGIHGINVGTTHELLKIIIYLRYCDCHCRHRLYS